MASWMVHLRVAEQLFDCFYDLCEEAFFMGNIAPDSGKPSEDWQTFTPSGAVSHFCDRVDVKSVNPERFADKYLRGMSHNRQSFSFYFGYYCHLVTDLLWAREVYRPAKQKYAAQLAEDPGFIRSMKKDWYDLDHLYLKQHPAFRGYRVYHDIQEFPNVYMDEFSEDAFIERHRYITDFYDAGAEGIERQYPYLTAQEMDAFVQYAVGEIVCERYAGQFTVSKAFLAQLPPSIKQYVEGVAFTEDHIGCSSSKLLLYANDMVLKVTSPGEETKNESRMMRWLNGKLPVPEIIAEVQAPLYETASHNTDASGGAMKNYMLMSRIKGINAIENQFLQQPHTAAVSLAQVLLQLWTVDISECPTDQSVDQKLATARRAFENGEINFEHFDPHDYDGAFQTPQEILDYLYLHKPQEDQVLSHGDFCLPNIFFTAENTLSGLIDFGRGGVSDRYQDIALALRSFRYNLMLNGLEGQYEACRDIFFRTLATEPDEEKLYYYRLLDEFF